MIFNGISYNKIKIIDFVKLKSITYYVWNSIYYLNAYYISNFLCIIILTLDGLNSKRNIIIIQGKKKGRKKTEKYNVCGHCWIDLIAIVINMKLAKRFKCSGGGLSWKG